MLPRPIFGLNVEGDPLEARENPACTKRWVTVDMPTGESMNAFLTAQSSPRLPMPGPSVPGHLVGHLTNSELAVFRSIQPKGAPSQPFQLQGQKLGSSRGFAEKVSRSSPTNTPRSPAAARGGPTLSDLAARTPRSAGRVGAGDGGTGRDGEAAYFSGTRYTSTGYPVLVPHPSSVRGIVSPRSL